ncbi:hypothetical protein D3C85_1213050 [compost metagenome]
MACTRRIRLTPNPNMQPSRLQDGANLLLNKGPLFFDDQYTIQVFHKRFNDFRIDRISHAQL